MVNIAIAQHGKPILGVMYVPVTRELYYADINKGKAYKTILNKDHESNGSFFNENDLIGLSPKTKDLLRVVGSRSHMNDDTLTFIEEQKTIIKILTLFLMAVL